VVLLT